MPSRHKSRQRALQILFLWEARGQSVEEAIDSYYQAIFPEEPAERDAFAAGLVRNIIRLAAYEMTRVGTPAAVAIDEALELARKFSGEDSVQFVNGVLDAIHREIAPPVETPSAE